MKKIILLGFGRPIIELYDNLKENFQILGICTDYERRKMFPDFYRFAANEKLDIIPFDQLPTFDFDAILVSNYNRKIDLHGLENRLLLNIHMGLLPVYRGNNANAWSILDGNTTVGYTLHEVSEVLDGGKIFYRFGYKIRDNETYFHAKVAMDADLKTNLSSVIEQSILGTLHGVDQTDEKFIYASKLLPEDGVLKGWDLKTQDILNRYMIFARPLGTGLKLKFQSQSYEVRGLSIIPHYLKSKGTPGAVVRRLPNGSIWVKTKDTAISIDEILIDGSSVRPAEFFKIGERL